MSKAALDKKIVSVAWDLFFIMLGGIWMVPAGNVPESAWLVGVGIILIGLNIIRYLSGIKMIWFSLILGVIATFTGVAGIYGVNLPVFPVILIINES